MSYSTSGPVETILRKEDTVDPVAGNDNTQGYDVQSRWINTSSSEEWVCTDASTGAAVWELTTGGFADAPDAALFTERADHVNTPAAGKAELWVENTANQSLQFTDDAGTDYDVCRTASSTALGRLVYGSGTQGELYTTNLVTYETATGFNLKGGVSLYIAEDDTPQATSAGYGRVWVKNDVPTTLQFTDDDDVAHSIMGDVVGPASATDNAIATFDATTGKLLQGTSDFLYNAGNLTMSSTSASIRFGFHTSSPSIAAGQARIFTNGSGSTAAALFKDNTDIRRMDLASSVTMASNALVDIDATEVVIGGAYIVGNDFSTFTWEILGTYNDNGGTGVQDLDVYLYDRGPDGTPVAGVLRSTLSIDTLDTLDRVSQTLTASGTPGVDTDTIFNTGRLYEVRAKLDAGGGVDTAKLLSVRFIES